MKIRGAYGSTIDNEESDDVVFVDDDRWQFCQKIGIHLGYFWCLAELNHLSEECTQNCKGVGVKMGDVRSTSSVSSSSFTSKRDKEQSFHETMNSFRSNMKKARVDSLNQLEMNILRDSISTLSTNLMFMKTEKYEGSKWVDHT